MRRVKLNQRCHLYYIILLLFTVKTVEVNSLNHSCNSGDLSSLYSFYDGLESKSVLDWSLNDSSSNCCNWVGVRCDFLGSAVGLRVTALDLSSRNLKGFLNDSFAMFDQLKYINLSNNSFHGPIPSSLFELPQLEVLDLGSNTFSGAIPAILNLPSIQVFNTSFNLCNGTLPILPGSWNLQAFDITGAIPDVFDKLKKLQTFDASSNGFSGFLPLSLSNCSSLKVLILRNNSLTGEINFGFSSLLRLKTIDLGANRFTGTIPFNLPECKQLETLNLARNKLVGEIPSSFANFTSINYLSLTGNNFSNLSQALQILQNLPKLMTLVLTNNFRGGETIPSEGITGFSNLRIFVIANCALHGSIPSWLANSIKLNLLDMSWNHLTGSVPPWLGNLDNLFYLDISNNSLNGQIPDSLTHMKSLTVFHNFSTWVVELPLFVMRNSTGRALQYNQVNSLPPSLILSHNKLVGSISPSFGNLRGLLVLDLSFNTLTGTIPNELSGMSNIETLDFSHNDLTGAIPASLIKLTFLSKFNVSYNNLTGEIPSGGQFSTFPHDYFVGNPGLFDRVNASSQSDTIERYNADIGMIVSVTIGFGVGVLTSVALYFRFFY